MLAMICLSNRNCRLSRNISKCNMREFSELPDRQISRRYLAISIHGHCSIPDSLVRPLEFTEGQSHWPTIHEKTAVEQFTAQQKCCINGPAHWMWEPIIRLLLLLAEWCYSKREKKKKVGGGKMFISIESIYNKFTPSHAELFARWRVSDPTARLFIYLIYKWNS